MTFSGASMQKIRDARHSHCAQKTPKDGVLGSQRAGVGCTGGWVGGSRRRVKGVQELCQPRLMSSPSSPTSKQDPSCVSVLCHRYSLDLMNRIMCVLWPEDKLFLAPTCHARTNFRGFWAEM